MNGQLLANAVAFGRVLRGLGLSAGPDRAVDLVLALDHVPIGRRADFYHAVRAVFVRRHEEIRRFDRAFEAFWRKPAEGETTLDLAAMGEKRRFRRATFSPAAPARADEGEAAPASPETPPLLRIARSYSAREALRHKDFGEMTGEELAQVRRAIAALRWTGPRRRTRRFSPGDGRRMDLRRTLRASLRHGGETLAWERLEPREKARPLVVLADISGSMENHTRMLLLFVYAMAEGLEGGVETFTFGTRLTRVTRELAGRDPEEALANVARAVPDWSGGTRIGEALSEFHRRWGRRVLSRGAAVLIVSDGWDRGDPDRLAAEMARLQRSCHRLIWLSPLAGAEGYEPSTRGLEAALPYVDNFLSVRDLASLEELARRLGSLPMFRPARPQHARLRDQASPSPPTTP